MYSSWTLVSSLAGVYFLREVNLGNKPEIGKKCAVIGGGNVAMDVCRTAVRLGAETYVIYRRSEDEMPADTEEVAEAREEGVKFCFLNPPAPKFEIDPATGNPREVEAYATRDKRVIDHVTGQYSRNPDGSFVIEMDGMGNPVQEIVFDEVSDTNVRDYYLQKAGYNKEQALQQIDQLYSRKDMRFALKQDFLHLKNYGKEVDQDQTF